VKERSINMLTTVDVNIHAIQNLLKKIDRKYSICFVTWALTNDRNILFVHE